MVMDEAALAADPDQSSTGKRRKKRSVALTEDGNVDIVREYAIGGDLPDQCNYGKNNITMLREYLNSVFTVNPWCLFLSTGSFWRWLCGFPYWERPLYQERFLSAESQDVQVPDHAQCDQDTV